MRTDAMTRTCLAGFVALACAACTVGPEPHKPAVDVPQGWAASRDPAIASDLPSRVETGPVDPHRWWSVFRDPVLDGLIQTAMDQSLDVQTAGLRIGEARAQRDRAAGAYYPQVQANGTAARLRSGASGVGSLLGGSSGGASGSSSSESDGFSTNLFQAGFDATWEPDLFGRVRRSVQAAQAQVRAAEDRRRAAMVSLAAEIARAYMALRGAERQRAITRADIGSQEKLQVLIDSRNRSGLAPASEVATQRVQVSGARARLPQIEQAITTNRNRLALLLAMPPGSVDERLGERALPALPPEVPVGLPGDLLRRRPDIRQREAEVDAATARIGVATSALFPSIRFGAVGSFSSNKASTLFDWASRFGLIGAQLSVPIFQGGQLRAQVRVADLQAQEAVLSYRQTVLAAFHDVDNAMTTYAQDQRRTVDLDRQAGESRHGRDLALDRYTSGLGAYIDVLNAEHQTNQVELDLAQSAATASTDLVALFKALGGGWEED
ncbi:MAG: efflux transporter outer membrane subunit [Burkholderiaceae bacterium]